MLFALAVAAVAANAAENERWVKVVAPEFTVITPLREKEALAWAGEFSQFVAALQDFIAVNPKRLPKLTMVLFARERDFARFKPLREDGKPMEIAGFFSRRPSWAVAGLAGTRLSEETRTTIFHEGTHWFLSAFELPNPVWLEEGLAEVFSTFAIEGKNFSWGRPIELHVQALRLLPQMPMEQLLFLSQDSLHGSGDEAELRTGIAYAQSWAFVHYLIFGQREVPKGALVEYVKRLRTMHPDEAFRSALGGTYAEVGKKLGEYLHTGKYYVAKQPLRAVAELKAEPASAVEVEDALARLRMAGGRHKEARENVERAIAAAPENPRGYELQGELALELDDATAAQAAFRKAVEKGSTDFRPYFELARAEHAAAGEDDGSVSGLTPEKARGIANRYERAINLNPRHLPAYQGLAGLVELVPAGNVEDGRFLELGLRLFPGDGMIRLGLATLAKREGNAERARELLKSVLDGTTPQPPHVTAYARRIDASWMQRDVFGRIEELANAKKFKEAVAVIDEQVAAGVDIVTRQRLQKAREDMQAAVWVEEAREAMGERRWDDAREKFNAVLESNASPFLKGQVRRQIEQMERRMPKKK